MFDDIFVIVVYGGPGILLMVGAPFVARMERVARAPRWLLAASMALLGATWVVGVAHWWLDYCWETWQPCDGSTIEEVLGVTWTVSWAGAIAGGLWSLISARAWRLALIGAGALAAIAAGVGAYLVFIDDPDGPGIDEKAVKNVVRPHLPQLNRDRSLECHPTDSTDVGLWRCVVKGTMRSYGRPLLIRVRADGRYSSRVVSGCCIESTD